MRMEGQKPGFDMETVMDKKTWHRTVEDAALEAQRRGTPLSVIFIDVNHFKDINDSLGHAYGDQVIAEIQGILSKNLRLDKNRPGKNNDLIFVNEADSSVIDGFGADLDLQSGHLGGDEFGILCKTDDNGARIVTSRLREAFDEYLQGESNTELKELGVSLAMGVSVLQENMTVSQLLQAADREMYEDKLRQLPPLTDEQREFLIGLHEELDKHRVRLRDIGKYVVLLSRETKP